jgi:hypothetical protein
MRKIVKASLAVLPGALILYWLLLLGNQKGNSLSGYMLKLNNESEAFRSLQSVNFKGMWVADRTEMVGACHLALRFLRFSERRHQTSILQQTPLRKEGQSNGDIEPVI